MGTAVKVVMWHGPFEQIFVPLAPGGSTWNLVKTGPVTFKKMLEIDTLEASRIKSQRMTLTSGTHKSSCKAEILQTFHEILCSRIFPYLTLP